MAADGSVIIDVLLDDDQVTSGMDNINDQVGKLKGIAGTVAKGLAVVGAAAGAAFVGFSKSAITAAADAQAINAQFEQVFGNLGDVAQKSIDDMANEFGMVSSRLKPSFTAMTSMFKGLGLDTEAAMEQAASATTMVADAAAFYDKSFEDANGALNSFIKGNYEGGESIGLFANETQLAAWASKELGTDWKTLDEAGKQITRLKYAESMQEAAGATGQAARESDGLQNLLGNLKAVWEDLMVQFGTPILPIVIEWLKKIASAIQNFDATPFINAFTFIWDALNKFVSQAVGIYETLKTSISGSGGLLAALGIDDAFIANVQGYLATAQDVFTLAFNGIMTVVQYAFGFIQTYIVPILSQIVSFIGEQLAVIQQFWAENGTQIVQAVTNAFNMVKSVIDFIMPAVLFVIDFIWTAIKQVITGALDVIMGLIKVFSGLFTGDFGKMWEGIKQIFFGAIDLIIGWMSLTFVGGLRTLLTNLGKAGFNILKKMWDDIANVFKNMGSTISGVVSKMATSIVNYFTNILTRAQGIFGTLRTFGASIWNSIRSTITNIAQKIWNDVVTKFTGLVSSIKNIFGTVKTTISTLWNEVIAFFKGINLETIGKNIIQGLINGIGSMGSKIKEKVEELANSLPQWMKKVLGIHSPSRVMAEIGKFTMIGFNNGMDSQKKNSEKIMTELGKALTDVEGPNLGDLQALNTSTEGQLDQYADLYQEKTELARLQASEELAGMKEDTANSIIALRETANAELEVLLREWVESIQAITQTTDKQLMSLKAIGRNAGQGLLDGLASMEPALIAKANAIAQAIKNAISAALQIHSPSRWMRDFVAGNMAEGWLQGIDKSQNAIIKKASQLGDWMKPEVPTNFVNKLRGVSVPLSNLGSTSLQNIRNSSNTNSYDQSRTMHNQITIQESSDTSRSVEKALRRLQFQFG